MAIPVKVPGEVLTADFVNQWCVPSAVTKTSNQSVTSSTTLVNDTAIVLNVAANATYLFTSMIVYEAANGGDLKWQWALPASASMVYNLAFINTGGTLGASVLIDNSVTSAAQGNGAGNLRDIQMVGTLTTLGTAGQMQFKWAQNTSSGTATIVHSQSSLALQRSS